MYEADDKNDERRMACNNQNHATSCFPFNIFWGCKKISKFDILVQNSFKYLTKELQIIKELLDTLACNIVKLKSKTAPSLAISHMISYKIVRNCAKTNVPTITLLTIPQPVQVQTPKGLASKI